MSNRKFWILLAGLAAMVLAVPAQVMASSHREAPMIANDPAADNTDVYAWMNKGAGDKVYIIGNWNTLEEPAGGPNYHKFSDNVRYEFHVARGNKDLFDKVTYYVRFRTTPKFPLHPRSKKRVALGQGKDIDKKTLDLIGGHQFFSQISGQTQTYSVWKINWTSRYRGRATRIVNNKPVAPVNIGPRTNALVYQTAKYDDAFTQKFIHTGSDGTRVFAGPRTDVFFVDLGATFDLANLRPIFAKDLKADPPQDHVANKNTHTIALEIPSKNLTANGQAPTAGKSVDQTLGIWAASSRRRITFRGWGGRRFDFGGWVQVSRLGFPLVNEAVIGLQDKDRFNASHPAYDVPRFGSYILNPVIVQDAEFVGIYGKLKATATDALKFNRTDIVTDVLNLGYNIPLSASGDVLRLDMGVDSGFPNGRKLGTDVVDLIVTYFLTQSLNVPPTGIDGVDKPAVAPTTSFPFMPVPREGYCCGGSLKITK